MEHLEYVLRHGDDRDIRLVICCCFNGTSTPEFYTDCHTLSLHDARPISASLIGDVIMGAGCYIGAGASLRGDVGRIVGEADANVQDNCTLHTGSGTDRSEEHTSELQSLMRSSYAVSCL